MKIERVYFVDESLPEVYVFISGEMPAWFEKSLIDIGRGKYINSLLRRKEVFDVLQKFGKLETYDTSVPQKWFDSNGCPDAIWEYSEKDYFGKPRFWSELFSTFKEILHSSEVKSTEMVEI